MTTLGANLAGLLVVALPGHAPVGGSFKHADRAEPVPSGQLSRGRHPASTPGPASSPR